MLNPKNGTDELASLTEVGAKVNGFGGMEVTRGPVETGWLLDDGILCIGGAPNYGLAMVTYTDPAAIRFARKQDAEAFARVLQGIGHNLLAFTTKAVEHQWG